MSSDRLEPNKIFYRKELAMNLTESFRSFFHARSEAFFVCFLCFLKIWSANYMSERQANTFFMHKIWARTMRKQNDYSIVCNFLATKSIFNATWQHVQLRRKKNAAIQICYDSCMSTTSQLHAEWRFKSHHCFI